MPSGPQPASTADIVLLNPNGYDDVDAAALRPWLASLVAGLGNGANSMAVRLIGDRGMRAMNQRYRAIDRATDVLSFPGEATPEGHHLGDVAISVPAARRQANELGHSLERELRCLILHGVLHCLGYDHETDGGEMHRLELDLRREWVDGAGGGA